jgi:hypothetical protein
VIASSAIVAIYEGQPFAGSLEITQFDGSDIKAGLA